MARKSLLYYLFSKNKAPLYQDDNGHILEGDPGNYKKPDGQPAHIEHSPDGWSNTLIKFARNIKYWGLFRDFSVPMSFYRDGSSILRSLMWTYGVEAICYLGILRLDRLNLPYNYENIYLSELNFSKYKQTKRSVEIEATEGGISKFLKAYENTVYEIPIDTDPEHVDVIMDGMEFDFSRTFGVVSDQQIRGTANFYLGMVETARESQALDVVFQDILPKTSSPYPNEDWYLNTFRNQEVIVEGHLEIFFNKGVPFELRAEVNDGVGSGTDQYSFVNIAGSPRPAGTTERFDFSETFTVPNGSRAHMKIYGGSPTDSETQFTVLSGEISIRYVYRHATTAVKGLYPYRLLEKIVDKMTNGQYGIKSSWLQSKRDIVVTSGDALRGIVTDNSDPDNPIKGAVIKTSLADFFKAFGIFSVGLGVEYATDNSTQYLVIDQLANFFSSDVIVDLGELTDAEIMPAEDIFFNTIKAGYEKQDYTDANGRFETNQGQQWTTSITKIVRELDMVSPYRTDPFGIELLRINYDQKKTTDTNSDNDPFMLNTVEPVTRYDVVASFVASSNTMVVPNTVRVRAGSVLGVMGSLSNNGQKTIETVTASGSGLILEITEPLTNESTVAITISIINGFTVDLYRPAYSSVTGIPHPDTAYNLELTPKKGLLNNGAMIRSILDLQDTEVIRFQSADKNAELSTTLNGVTVKENEDIQVGSLPARLFRPYYISGKSAFSGNVISILRQTPYGKAKFSIDGKPFYGFFWDGGENVGERKVQDLQLLSAPENDLTRFNYG